MADSMDSRLNTVSSIVSGFEITWYSVWLVSMVLFLARHNTPCIRSRTILLSSTQAVGHLLVMFFSGGCDYLGADIPCFLRMWLINLGFTAWSIALMSRFVLLYTSYRRNLNILFNPAASTPEYEVDEFGCPVEKPEGLDENKGSKESLYRGSHVDPPPSKCSPWDFATIIANMKLRFMRRTDAWIMEGSIQKQFWKPIVAIVLLMLVYLSLAQVFTQTARIRVGSGSRLCSFGALEYGFALCWGILSLCVGGSFMMWICFSCPDTDYIFSDLTLSCVSGILLAFVYLILSSNSRLSLYAHSSWLFLEVLLVLSHITSIIVPVIQSFIEGWKATRVTFDMNHFAFEQVLRHRILYADLKKFAESEMCGVNCLFLEALKEIKRESKVHIRSSTLTFVLDEGDNPSWGESTTRFSSTIVGPIERSTIPVIKAPSSISEDGGTRSSTGSSDAGSRVTVTHHSRTASFASPMELHRHSNTFMGDTYSPNKSSASGSPENNHTSPSQRATSFHLDLNSLQPPQGNSRCSSASASATVLGPSGGQMALLISLDSWRAKTAPGTIFHGTKQDISQLAKLGSQGNLFNRWTGSSTTVSSRRSDNPFTRKKDAFDHCAVPDAVKFKYKLVYEVYCRVGAPCELNLPHKLRLELKDLAENGKFCVGSYEEARAHVIHLLFSNIYARWACQHLEQGNSYDLTNGTLIKRHSFWLPPPRTNSPLK